MTGSLIITFDEQTKGRDGTYFVVTVNGQQRQDYYFDSAESVLRYFLSNAQGWKGETAKRIKQEIKDILKTCK